MKVTALEPGKIYRNNRGHLALMHGRHICYIDIPRDAIVYTTLKSIENQDWEVLSPELENAAQSSPENLSREEEEELTLFRNEREDVYAEPETVAEVDAPKRRGRPKKNANV